MHKKDFGQLQSLCKGGKVGHNETGRADRQRYINQSELLVRLTTEMLSQVRVRFFHPGGVKKKVQIQQVRQRGSTELCSYSAQADDFNHGRGKQLGNSC